MQVCDYKPKLMEKHLVKTPEHCWQSNTADKQKQAHLPQFNCDFISVSSHSL